MKLQQETISFLVFVCLGIFYGIIFDFFRALRKAKKRKDLVVSIQDIIYFIIVGIVLAVVMYVYMREKVRIYILLSIFLGIAIYVSLVGNKVVGLFTKIIMAYNKIVEFIFIPFDIIRQIFAKQINFFKNIVIKCCKRFFYVVKSNYGYILQKKDKLVTKEGKKCQEQGAFYKFKKRKRRLS